MEAIGAGDVERLRALLAERPGLARARIGGADRWRTPLGLLADWPGHRPRAREGAAALIAAGADPDRPCSEAHREAALHWAASSDDLELLEGLLDAGADLEVSGAVIAGGTPLDDAVAFAQWRAARRLVERGACTALWHAAALGLLERVEAHFAGAPLPAPHPWGASAGAAARALDVALWCACHGGQQAAAALLLARGADLAWVAPWEPLTPLGAARRHGDAELVRWLEAQARA